MDAPTLTDLVTRHSGLIHKVAWTYCRDRAEREDVVQDILLQLWRSRHRYDPRFKATTWIYRVALNVAISHHRRERRHHDGRQGEDVHHLNLVAPEEVAPSAELELLRRGIEELGALERALVLLYLDGNDHATTAEVLGLSVSNVGTKLARIKDRLRAALSGSAPLEPTETRHATR